MLTREMTFHFFCPKILSNNGSEAPFLSLQKFSVRFKEIGNFLFCEKKMLQKFSRQQHLDLQTH